MKQCFTGYGLLICRFWWQRCRRVPTISPCQHFPRPHNAQAFQLALCSCSQGPCWSGNWSSWNKLQKQNTNQNKPKKKEENKILPILQGILFMVFNPHQFLMQLAAGSHKELFGHNSERAELGQNGRKKSLRWEHLKVVLRLKLLCPQTMAGVSYLGLTSSTRSP